MILGELRDLRKPVIHFGTNTSTLLDQMRDEGAAVIGVDWRVDLDVAWKSIGANLAIQGNLDPSVLLGPWASVREQATGVLRRAAGRAGHIFNLGHGILPQTPLDNLLRLVEFVHQYSLPTSGVSSGV
jgi:uroporphyrinogen decarboxylase